MKRAAILALFLLPAALPSAAQPADRFRVGIVTEPQGVNVPIYRLMRDGLERAVRDLGVEGRVLTPGAKEGYLSSFSSLARRGYDLVIADPGWMQAGRDLNAAARRFPKTEFVSLDVPLEVLSSSRLKNVSAVLFAEQEVGYLAGYLAALTEKRRPGPDVISSVGAFKRFPAVDHFIAGYEAGARKISPGITALHSFTFDFLDRAKCKRAALAQIAKGSGVVFNVAGDCGFGALAAAKQKGVWGIGVDVDQSSLGPHILTSAIKRFDMAVFEVIEQAKKGRFERNRTTILRLRDGALGLGKISPTTPRTFVARVERIKRQIVSGKITNIPTRVP